MSMADHALRAQTRIDAAIQALGNDYVIRETGETFKAIMSPLAVADFPTVSLEGGRNVNELDPQSLWAVERTANLLPGQNLYLSGASDPDADNYVCEGVNQVTTSGIVVRVYSLIYSSPIVP